jgi:cation:H+ antiporter
MLTYFKFIVGFAVIIKGADFLMDVSSSIVRQFRVSEWVIGVTVVAFGTSTPKRFVNINYCEPKG